MTRTPTCRKLAAGFTLIELMVTVAVAGILASIALPSYRSYVAKQRVSAGQADLVALGANLDGYLLNNTAYPDAASGEQAIRQVLPGWAPVQKADFSYEIVATSSSSFPPTYSVRAKGTSSVTSGCVIDLSSTGTRTKSGCAGGSTSW